MLWVILGPIILSFGYWRYYVINQHLEKGEYPLERGMGYILSGVIGLAAITLALVAVSL